MLRFLSFAVLAAMLVTGCSSLSFLGDDESRRAYRKLTAQTDVRVEYGWFCEYSTVGMPPEQRQAAVALVENEKTGLLQKALNGPNIEGRVYAADALLYLERNGKYDMPAAVQNSINGLRSRSDSIQTCGNAGSYRIYLEPIKEVLSDSAIAEIPAGYEGLAEYGWFRP